MRTKPPGDEESPGDQRAAELEDGFMNFTQPVPANSESAELLQPADGPLDRPTNGSQMIRFGFPTTGNSRFDPRCVQQGSTGRAVITLVSRHGPRCLSADVPLDSFVPSMASPPIIPEELKPSRKN